MHQPIMKRLSESFVQNSSLAYLLKANKFKSTNGKFFAKKEVRTKRKYGSKRADGLLAYRHWIWGIYTISIEAKSFKTLPAIKPYQDDKLLFKNSLKAGGMICIASGAIFAFLKMNDGFLQYLLPLNVFVLTALLYAFWRFGSYRHQDAKVLGQSDQYPANERWLALSQDSLNDLKKEQAKTLKKICQSRGVGVLVVKSNGKVRKWIRPKMRWKWLGNFVEFYSNEDKILKMITQ